MNDRHGVRTLQANWCACGLAAAMALLAIEWIDSIAVAQNSPPPGEETCEFCWDLADEVNRSETRAFFHALWGAEDAGIEPPRFEFTNEAPGLTLAMLLPELEVFAAIYRHRLQPNFDSGPRYLVTNLIHDDPEARAQFRRFVLTGMLGPRPEVDFDAFAEHYLLIADALSLQAHATVACIEVQGGCIQSQGMTLVPAAPVSDELTSTTPTPDELTTETRALRCALKWLTHMSSLECIRRSGLFIGRTGVADFDCDDYADAMLRYILRRLPSGWTGKYGLVSWRCPPAGAGGHAVPVLIDPSGRYWWIDPKTGDVFGPFDGQGVQGALEEVLGRIRRKYAPTGCSGTWYDPSTRTSILDQLREMSPSGLGGWLGEGPLWFTDQSLRVAFCEALKDCCLKNCHPACEGDLPNWIPREDRTNCDSSWYVPEVMPGGDVPPSADWPCTPAAN